MQPSIGRSDPIRSLQYILVRPSSPIRPATAGGSLLRRPGAVGLAGRRVSVSSDSLIAELLRKHGAKE